MEQGWRRRRVAHAHRIRDPRTPAWAPAPALGNVVPSRRAASPAVAVGALVILGVAIVGGLAMNGGWLRAATAADRSSPSPAPSVSASTSAGPEALAPSPAGASPSDAPTGSLAPGAPTGYRWPLDHGRITTVFGPQAGGIYLADGVPYHDGLDIASFCGDRIVAAHDGVVLAAGRHVDRYLGWVGDVDAYVARLDAKDRWGTRAVVVIIDDGNGYRSEYVHLYKATVKAGQRVTAGEFIGWEGQTGLATGCHLHYAIFDPTDPRMFFTDPALVKRDLLPVAEIARIDPFTILPPMSTTRVTWGWGAQPSAAP
jgi:murein DD-endopeptidase MepM/ murein hydrolase activator NlpD